jgi:hypothetical protein
MCCGQKRQIQHFRKVLSPFLFPSQEGNLSISDNCIRSEKKYSDNGILLPGATKCYPGQELQTSFLNQFTPSNITFQDWESIHSIYFLRLIVHQIS